ncbi:ferrous iron transporter B [Halalkaliarchaeum desulfuricum]|uniref:ferrous iron transporter B n=1 Tax=Halalkaliarchaeum desulfuricum TaxID=2055893 RepID=UPI001C30E234|nr:ferrous iron transporter B [Halalkaliarchaeum desulfuricum]
MDADSEDTRVALLGPPNVGKSVLFNALTGLDAGIANYPGTTVEYKRGTATFRGEEATLIDVPGTYSLSATNEAEQLAVDILDGGCDVVVCVLDAANLESSLHLLLQVLEHDVPTVVAINRVDLLEEGRRLRAEVLARELSVPVIPTVATIGKGFEQLVDAVAGTLRNPTVPGGDEATWDRAEELVEIAIVDESSGGSTPAGTLQLWGDRLVEPWPGLPVAVLVLVGTFAIVVGLGMGLRQYLLIPVFEGFVFPVIEGAVRSVTDPGLVRAVLIGEYGFLIKGIEWPFALVMPYVISFYIALSLLEDSGYLPRLAVLLDGLFARIGLTGSNVVPLLLGYGCAIPGITGSRAAETYKQRLSITLMICLAVPCVAQTGAFIALLAEATILLVIAVFFVSFLALAVAGVVLDRVLEGDRNPTVADVPPLLIPKAHITANKVWMRLKHYLFGGAVHMIYAIGVASLLYELGILELIGEHLRPLVVGWLLLPEEAATPLMLGIVRRELTVLPLLEMDLSTGQLFVGAVVGLFYVPCIAVFATVAEEFDIRIAGVVLVLTMGVSFLIGGVIAQTLALF